MTDATTIPLPGGWYFTAISCNDMRVLFSPDDTDMGLWRDANARAFAAAMSADVAEVERLKRDLAEARTLPAELVALHAAWEAMRKPGRCFDMLLHDRYVHACLAFVSTLAAGQPRTQAEADGADIGRAVRDLRREHPDKWRQAGVDHHLAGWFVGQVMVRLSGRADQKLVSDIVDLSLELLPPAPTQAADPRPTGEGVGR